MFIKIFIKRVSTKFILKTDYTYNPHRMISLNSNFFNVIKPCLHK